MQTDQKPRRNRTWWYALAVLLSLGTVALVLYSTGAYDSWRAERSLDKACDGTLAQDGLEAALGTSDLKADADEGSATECFVRPSGTGKGRGVQVTLRWDTASAPSGEAARYREAANGVSGQAAPLGRGWPGVVRNDGTWQVMVTLSCTNRKGKALDVYGDLYGTSAPSALNGLGRVTTQTAEKAAAKYGCRATTGKSVTTVPATRLGTPDSARPLKQASGSCAALRPLASAAARNGAPEAAEYPSDAHTPQVNCFLVTPDGKPAYGLYAYYGSMARDFLASGPSRISGSHARASAQCSGPSGEAAFVIYRLYDKDTESYPVPYSEQFAKSALKTFADHEARARGCTDVHLSAAP